jgi:hypothetical protein
MSFRSEGDVSVGSETQDPNDTKYSSAQAAANEKLYEPKKIRKLVRVLTVTAYVLSVSLAAIILSLYYLFLWDPKVPSVGKEGISMALTDPEPHQNASCVNLGNASKTSVFPTLLHNLDLLYHFICKNARFRKLVLVP